MFKFFVILFAALTAFIERVLYASFTEYAMRFYSQAFASVSAAIWACVRWASLARLYGLYFGLKVSYYFRMFSLKAFYFFRMACFKLELFTLNVEKFFFHGQQ